MARLETKIYTDAVATVCMWLGGTTVPVQTLA